MDLLGNYASSDEDEHERQPSPPPPQPQLVPATNSAQSESASKRGGIFNSLPPPKLSLFNSLPPPKSQSSSNPKPQSEAEHGLDEKITENPKPKLSSSSLFSSLPRPNSSSSASSAAKKVIQFRPPVITNTYSRGLDEDDHDDEDDKGEEERKRKRSSENISTISAASFLSSIPAPKHSATLGVLPSASGMGRRSMLETSSPASNVSTGTDAGANTDVVYSNNESNDANYANYSDTGSGIDAGSNPDLINYGGCDHSAGVGGENYAYYAEYSEAPTDANNVSTAGVDAGSYEGIDYSYAQGNHVGYPNYGSGYGDFANNPLYENNWGNLAALPESSVSIENAMPVFKRRGRKDVPPEIVEVKQDELIKNRPREDQVKSTGIAFGPAYQPASTKGKPTKLHKRKHQIGSLYFDMRQKETELAERRSKGFLTKSQTQAKYGW